MTIASATILMILVIDPLGNIPFFLTALQHVEPARQNRVMVRELVIAYLVMVGFLFAGQPLLDVLHSGIVLRLLNPLPNLFILIFLFCARAAQSTGRGRI